MLATEMLEALGVETSKTFSLIETGEALERDDEPSPTRSAVLVRLSHGHIRIGTFQRLAYARARPTISRSSTDYCLRHYYGDEPAATTRRPRLLDHVAARSRPARRLLHRRRLRPRRAQLATISRSPRESFDYGPWRWTPFWDGHFTAAYFDHAGLYAFGRQPEAIHWDLRPARRCAARRSPRPRR